MMLSGLCVLVQAVADLAGELYSDLYMARAEERWVLLSEGKLI